MGLFLQDVLFLIFYFILSLEQRRLTRRHLAVEYFIPSAFLALVRTLSFLHFLSPKPRAPKANWGLRLASIVWAAVGRLAGAKPEAGAVLLRCNAALCWTKGRGGNGGGDGSSKKKQSLSLFLKVGAQRNIERTNARLNKEGALSGKFGAGVSPDLGRRGSPAWSAAGKTGGAQTDQGCPFGGRRTPARGGGASARRPNLGEYLEGNGKKRRWSEVDISYCMWGHHRAAGSSLAIKDIRAGCYC